MIIDSHTHAWPRWPYQPPVPDDESRGRVEQLLHEMDLHDIDKAVLVCARIDRNPENNDYVAACVQRYPERLIQFADVDCSWTETYHTDGAADRLKTAAEAYALKGYTHYLRGDDDGSWFFSGEGQRFFQTTADLGLIASIAMGSHQHEALRKLAGQFPTVPFLCHHMGGARAGEEHPYPQLKQVLASGTCRTFISRCRGSLTSHRFHGIIHSQTHTGLCAHSMNTSVPAVSAGALTIRLSATL